jgi:hypothetical protein
MRRRLSFIALLAFAVALSGTTQTLGAAQSAKPTLRAAHAIAVEGSRALLLGSVNPRGLKTDWYFQLGTTKAYGLPLARTSLEDPLEGFGANAVEEVVSCLAPKTTYHFRLVARNKAGRSFGPDHSFKTKRLLVSSDAAYNLCPGHKPLRFSSH